MRIKHWSQITCVEVLLALGLSACGTSPNLPSLTIGYESGIAADALARLIREEFQPKTGIQVSLITVPYEKLHEKYSTEFVAGSGSFDLVGIPHYWKSAFADAGYILPLDDFIRRYQIDIEGFVPILWKAQSLWRGKSWAIPLAGDVQIYVYRKDLFENPVIQQEFQEKYHRKLEPAQTWQEYRLISEFFYKSKHTPFGNIQCAQKGDAIICEFWNLLTGFGLRLLDDEMKPSSLRTQQALKALEFYLSLLKTSQPSSPSNWFFEGMKAFTEGQGPHMVMWDGVLLPLEDPTSSKVVGKIGYRKNLLGPRQPGAHVGGWGLAVSKDAHHKESAFQFLQWISDDRVYKKFALYSGLPTRTATFQDPEVVAKHPFLAANVETYAEAKATRPTIPEWPEIQEIMGVWLSKAAIGEASASQALETSAGEIERILKEAGYYERPSNELKQVSQESQLVVEATRTATSLSP